MTNMRRTQWGKTSDDKSSVRTVGGDGGASIPSRSGGESLRDVDQRNKTQASIYLVPPFEAFYTEPMLLKLESEPTGGIVLLRVLRVNGTGLPVPSGGMVHFEWDQLSGQAKVTSIDGLISGDTLYRFFFMAVG